MRLFALHCLLLRLAWALAQAAFAPGPAYLSQLLSTVAARMGDLQPHELSDLGWAVAKLGAPADDGGAWVAAYLQVGKPVMACLGAPIDDSIAWVAASFLQIAMLGRVRDGRTGGASRRRRCLGGCVLAGVCA